LLEAPNIDLGAGAVAAGGGGGAGRIWINTADLKDGSAVVSPAASVAAL
jgi:hypothetical protein